MKPRRGHDSDTGPARRLRAAPPLTHHDGEPEGAGILAELSGAAGAVVWGALRDLMLWIETPPRERRGLFPAGASERREAQLHGAEADSAIWAPLLVIAAMTDAPATVDDARLLHACRSITRWAEEEDLPLTELAFAQAAALMRPDDAGLAVEVGGLAREANQMARAESWFRYAVRLARGGDWESYVWAYVGLGVLYIRSGNRPAATVLMNRALRSARRRRERNLEGVAHHHLFHLAAEAGRFSDAYQHARQALEAYGSHYSRLPALVHDVGRFWIHVGQFARSIPLLNAALPHVTKRPERAIIAANIARAAAGSGDRVQYASARAFAMELIGAARSPARRADAYAALAHADLCAGEWAQAEESAGLAYRYAAESGNGEVQLTAEAQVEAARLGRRTANTTTTEPLGAARQGELLAGELVRSLSAA